MRLKVGVTLIVQLLVRRTEIIHEGSAHLLKHSVCYSAAGSILFLSFPVGVFIVFHFLPAFEFAYHFDFVESVSLLQKFLHCFLLQKPNAFMMTLGCFSSLETGVIIV
jgi:hypothetical protein